MTRDEFQDVVSQALEELPEEFQQAIENLDIQVRWAPTAADRRRHRLRPWRQSPPVRCPLARIG